MNQKQKQLKKMHICFIIDNSPLTKQTYNYTNGTNCTNSNMTILETIKISVQTMLNELNRNGILMRDYQTLHLFVTSNPHMPISSVENGQQHFNYQLKEIKSSDTMTFPGQTILFALKHISRFRILTETETLLGYREGLIYEPALIIFISYGLTMRKINQIQSTNIHKQMRSEYKFAHFRLCYPSQLEKDKNIQKYKQQVENSLQNRKFLELVEKLNRGQHRNIIRYTGKQCLSDMLVRLFTTYRPTLSCNLLFDSQNMNKIKMLNPQYFTNSELGSQIFMFASDNTTNLIKVELLVKNEQRNSNSGTVENSNRNLIPLPFQAVLKQQVNLYKVQYNIDEVSPIQFYIDISKKLSKNLNMCLPVISYVLNTSSKLAKLQKELQRLGINEIGFPVYSVNIFGQNKKQKQFYLLGFLHYSKSSKQTDNYYFSLVLSFPDFPMLDQIVSNIQTQRVDNRKLQKLMTGYHFRIPQFYQKFVSRFFKRQGIMKPVYNMYEILSTNNWCNASNISQSYAIRSSKFKQLQMKEHIVQNARGEQKALLEKHRNQNINKHTNHTAECCPIYNDPNIYKNYMRKTAKKWQNKKSSLKQTSCEAVLSHLLAKVCEFNQKYGIKSYFGGSQTIKQSSMTRQTDRYMQKSYTENLRFGQMNKEFQFAAPNQSANYSTIGLNATKKIKRIGLSSQQEQQMRISQENISQKNDDIFESIMGEQNEELLMSGSQIEEQMQQQALEVNQDANNQIDYINKIRQQIQSPNSINIQSLKGSEYGSEVNEIKEMERQLLRNKRNAQKSYTINKGQEALSSMQNQIEQNDTIIKRSSLEHQSEIEKKQSLKQRQKQYEILKKERTSKMLEYINKISLNEQKLENKVKMSISTIACNLKEGKFEQNIIKLARVGLVKDLNQYINDNIKQ